MTDDRPIRPTRAADTDYLIDPEPDWTRDWWGMPGFSNGDARPAHRVVMNFMTTKDLESFSALTGVRLTPRSDTAWFPHRPRLTGEYYYDGPETGSKYPVCIPSKGRAEIQKTGKALDRLGVAYKFFVEETEYDAYCRCVGESNVVRLPFHDLGRGSIPARNFIWDWCAEREHPRHWVVDDNIQSFLRCDKNYRLRVFGGGFFRAMEDFVDRYENVRLAGPHDIAFVKDNNPNLKPLMWNSRVYSCVLVDTALRHRWRGRYNEDTDLSLRVLKDKDCTLLFHALLMNKTTTHYGGAGNGAMPGGNTDTVYATGDYRRAFADALREQHPDVVEVVWKFNRWHHQVDYSPFRGNRPKLKAKRTRVVSPCPFPGL